MRGHGLRLCCIRLKEVSLPHLEDVAQFLERIAWHALGIHPPDFLTGQTDVSTGYLANMYKHVAFLNGGHTTRLRAYESSVNSESSRIVGGTVADHDGVLALAEQVDRRHETLIPCTVSPDVDSNAFA